MTTYEQIDKLYDELYAKIKKDVIESGTTNREDIKSQMIGRLCYLLAVEKTVNKELRND